jgi:hypothetical protein
MAQTEPLGIVSPDADSVLVPLHAHFAALASSADKAITDRFQVKHLKYENVTLRDTDDYDEVTGEPKSETSGKPNLEEGDLSFINTNKRQFMWNKDGDTGKWMPLSKQFIFGSLSERNAVLGEDLYQGDTCYVNDIAQFCYWTGSEWIGEWKAWTPTVAGWTGSTVNYARYRQDGKNIYYEIKITGGASAPSSMTITPPVPPNTTTAEPDMPAGTGLLRMSNIYVLQNTWITGSFFRPLTQSSAVGQLGQFSSTAPATYATGCILRIAGVYEAL